MPTNTLINNYYLKAEHLQSAYKHLCKIGNYEQSYFVTIQPTKKIWGQNDATEYINTLLPKTAPVVVLLEKNDKISYKQKSKSYELDPTLHIHAYILERDLKHFKDIVIYRDDKDLSNKKKALGIKQIHIVARKVFTPEPPTYLLKQSDNTHLPFKLNFCAEVKKMLPIYKKKNTSTMEHTNVSNLNQLLRFGNTYSQTIAIYKKDKQAQQRSNALLNNSLIVFLKRKKTSPLQSINQLNKYVPYRPNAPTD